MLVVSAVVIAERRLTSSNLNGRKLAFGSDAALQRAREMPTPRSFLPALHIICVIPPSISDPAPAALTYRIQSRDFANRSTKIIWRAFPPLHTELDTPSLGFTASPLESNSDTL
jgi:hypothetical protein